MGAFFKLESAAGSLLFFAALLAMFFSNTPLRESYESLLQIPLKISAGEVSIAKPLLLWINEGLMAIFFLLVGLEIKREVLRGELSTPRKLALPAIAALGGMLLPALIYVLINRNNDDALRGWAIPSATDIAFALGVLTLLGSRVPASFKAFLTAVAILDDLGAIIIIALFYSSGLSLGMVIAAAVVIVIMVVLNLAGVTRLGIYLCLGIVLWLCVVKSGVHATLAGVITALAVPLRTPERGGNPPLLKLEHALHPWVAFGVLPLFGLANAGISFSGVTAHSFTAPVTLGIIAGLVVGKACGIFSACWIAVKLNIAELPSKATWRSLFALSIMGGVGFTMSLFIGSLAFENLDAQYMSAVKLGVISGSLISALIGYWMLRAQHDVAKAPLAQQH